MKLRTIISLIVLIFTISGALADPKDLPGHFAYLLRLDDNQKEHLVKFDIEKDEINQEILLPKNNAFNNFLLDESGGCYISNYRQTDTYGKDIYYYNPFNKNIEKFISFENLFGPRYLALNRNTLIVEMYGKKGPQSDSLIIFIDRNTKKILKEIFISKAGSSYTNVCDIFFDGQKYLYLTSINFGTQNEADRYGGNIYVIDVEKMEIINTISLPEKYKMIDGIVACDQKLYIAPAGIPDPNPGIVIGINDEILVYSLAEAKLIKIIKTSGHPLKLAYDPSVKKIYVQHRDDFQPRNDVEIIDVETDKIIKKLKIPSQLMFSVVKPGKIYLTVGSAFLTPGRTKPALLVLDTKTDKIIKTIYGNYKGISINNSIY